LLAGLVVVALVIEVERRASADTLLGLVVALSAVAGWLAWSVRSRVRRRAGRDPDDVIGAALDEIATSTLVLDRSAIVLDASPATAAIFGYLPEDLVGIAFDTLADPDDRADILDVVGPAEGLPRNRAWRIRHSRAKISRARAAPVSIGRSRLPIRSRMTPCA